MSTLYMVGTPIGNLKDITYRAVEVLGSVDFVVAEDTRVTAKLLQHYGIKKPLVSLRARSARADFDRVAARIAAGESAAYVTDAGTPGVSDPGGLLVERAVASGVSVVAVPGASALAAAISLAGIPLDEFVFDGFLPHKKGRQSALDAIAADERAHIIYESPHRIQKFLGEMAARVPERRIVILRELTKMFEERIEGTAAELAAGQVTARGEFVVIVGAL